MSSKNYYNANINLTDMHANTKSALIMKEMGNGHIRPYMWGSELTMVSGLSEVLVASGSMAGVYVDDCVYVMSPTTAEADPFYVEKDETEHTVKIKKVTGTVSVAAKFDILVFMSTAVTVDIADYAGKKTYAPGTC